ncbi:Uncharacterized protein QTN25_001329 [Entamoeba marina]
MSDTFLLLHKTRLHIGHIRQVLEIISLRTESNPIPMYAPISALRNHDPVALLPATISPQNLNTMTVQLNDEYFIELSAKETELRLNEKIKELEKEEEVLVKQLKSESEKAQNELEGDVRNITEYMTEAEYEEMMKSYKPNKGKIEVDWEKEKEFWKKSQELENKLESLGKLEFVDSIHQTVEEIQENEWSDLPAIKPQIMERKNVKQTQSSPTQKNNVIQHDIKEKKTEQPTNKPKKMSLFAQRQKK